VAHVSPAHCSGETAIHAFGDILGSGYVSAGVGAVMKIPLTGACKNSGQ
jgi:metal-dependent hydrolase (beta-lactamase superfamily II)